MPIVVAAGLCYDRKVWLAEARFFHLPPARRMRTDMNVAVIGAQWGDEGKGKIVDLLTPNFSIVARYQGGHNAGHTVLVGGTKFVLHLLPSGILHPGVDCVIGNGVVVDPEALFLEIETLAQYGIEVGDRLAISEKAHLILPYHRDLDLLSEARRGDRKIGTTSRGIGPAYEDKIGRRGIRVCDLADPSGLAEQVRENVMARNRLIGDSTLEWQPLFEHLVTYGERMRPWVKDVSLLLARARAEGKNILFEGAQGTFLDVDHGTYPFVTSSNSTAGGVCTGLGIGPRAIDGVLGVAKAYTTRVGGGPLPTELSGPMADRLREGGQEYGASTGRPRRCGWFDAVAVRYAARVNGLDSIALTKMDVLDGLKYIDVCTAYRCGERTLTEFPGDLRQLAACRPVYERLPGWSRPTHGVRTFDDLPDEARAYIARLEALTGVPMGIISTGSDRNETILRGDSTAASWFGRTR